MFREILLDRFNIPVICSIVILVLGTLSATAEESPSELLYRAERLRQGGVVMEAITTYQQYLEQVPDDYEARIVLVQMLLDMRQKERAIPHIQKLRLVKSSDPRVRRFITIADEFIATRRQRQVENYANQVRLGNASPATILKYARYLGGSNQPTEAIKIYRRYLTTNPNNNVARLEMAKQLAWMRRYAQCHDELNILLTRNPNNIRARMLLGDIFYWQAKEEMALECYRRILEVSPNHRGAKQKIQRITTTPGYREEQLLQALEDDPEGEVLNDLAAYYLDVGREYEADSLAKKRLRFAPDDSVALQLIGVIGQHRQERLAAQIARYEEILSRMPTDTTARLALARYYASVPKFQIALEHYDRYLQQYPMDYRVRLERAQILSWSGDPEAAIEEFRVVAVALPDNRESRIGLGEALLIANLNLEEAERIFREDLEDHPDDLRSRLGYADALRRQGKSPEARTEYEIILESDPTDQEALRGLYLLDHDVGPLILQLEQQLTDNPDNAAMKRRLAGLYYDSKRYYEAEQLVVELLEVFPDALPLQQFLDEIRASKERYQSNELRDAKQSVQEHPEDLDIRMNYAELLAANGRYEDAVAQYQLILEHRPDDQELMVKIAELLVETKRLKNASEIYGRLADENPANFDYRFRYAQLLSWMGDNERALVEYERALRLDPESLKCQFGIANAYRWKGDLYAAHDAYSRILASRPRNKTARKALRELNGALLRGFGATTHTSWDNESYGYRENRFIVMGSFSLNMQVRIGTGSVYFEQQDSTRRYLFAERGWFVFGNFDYRFDELTSMSAEARYHIYAGRKKVAFWVKLGHDFDDVPELTDVVGSITYSSQDAIFDLASSRSLSTWTQGLTSEKITVWANYTPPKKWSLEGELNYISISDHNSRMDVWVVGDYKLRKYFSVGARYDRVQAQKAVQDYWSPLDYQTVSGWARLSNDFSHWGYSFYGSAGRILSTEDSIRRFDGQINYRLSTRVFLNASYIFLNTVRIDGEYQYSGASLSLLMNW